MSRKMVHETFLRARLNPLRCTSCASGHSPLRRAHLKNSPDLISTPLLVPPAARDRMKAMSLWKGSFRLRVKSLAERLASGSMTLGIRLQKDATMGLSWHDFSWQDRCHDNQLLDDSFGVSFKPCLFAWEQVSHKTNRVASKYGTVSGSYGI